MIQTPSSREVTSVIKASVQVLEHFAESSRVSFQRPLAQRTVTETVRALPGDGLHVWFQRMVEAGKGLNLRIRCTELSVKDASSLVRRGFTVASCFHSGQGGDSEFQWIAIDEIRRGRARVLRFDGSAPVWMRLSRLAKLLQRSGGSEIRWITGQPALACAVDVPSSTTPGQPIKPFERLLGMMRIERSDIWAVLVFSVIVGILALAAPITVEALVNTVAFGRYLQPVVILSIILMTFLGFAAAVRALTIFIAELIQRRLFVRVVEDLAYRLPRVKQTAIDGSYAPELVNRFFDVVTVQKTSAKLLLDGITILLTTVLGMAILAFYHPFLLGFDVVLLLFIGFIVFGLGRNAVQTAIHESQNKYKVAAWLQELARHPTAFKLHGGEQFGLDRADTLAVDYLQARKRHFRIVMRQIIFALGLQAIAATALLGLGGWLVIQGELTLGQLVAAELIVMNIVSSFAKIGKHLESFYDLLASLHKLGRVLDLPIEAQDRLFHLEDSAAASMSLRSVTQVLGKKSLHNGLSFELAAGQSAAVVGPAGAGKSALLDLITGVRRPTKGHILIDGVDIRELRPDSLREHVSLSRGIEIFNGTIEENIHLHRPQVNAADVREALAAVGLLDEIGALPQGTHTQVQTDGVPLTSSQAVRLMIARAIVSRPRLLLIDGTLDSLGDDVLEATWAGIQGSGCPWTLLVATGRSDIASRLDHALDLGDNSVRQINVERSLT